MTRRTWARRTWARRTWAPGPDDAGQVLVLTIAYAALALLLVTAVVSATTVHLDRKALLATADQAALAGAGALDLDRYYARSSTSGGTDGPVALVQVSDDSVRRAVEAYLAQVDTGTLAVSLVDASSPDGTTAEVTLRSRSTPAWISWVTAPWSDGIVLEVTGRARAG